MNFQDLFCITTLTSLLLALVDAENPQIVPSRDHGQDQGIHQMNQQQRASRFRDKNHIQDKDHIMEHLEDIIDKPESEMTEAELQLHYFKMHDYDNNNKLDGLELIQALTHFHHDEEGQEGNQKNQMTEKEMEELIDPILAEEDDNSDGYIDYPEFAKTQN